MRWTANFLLTSKEEQSKLLGVVAVRDQFQRPEHLAKSDCTCIKELNIMLVAASSFSLILFIDQDPVVKVVTGRLLCMHRSIKPLHNDSLLLQSYSP